MKKFILLTSTLAVAGVMSIANAAPSASVTKDILEITFKGYKTPTTMYEAYTSDTANGISIMGPAFTTTSAVATVEVWGASSRSVGSPSMKVERSTTSGECELDFTYGPSHALSFTDNVQPFCRDVGMVVSNMKQIDATHYAVTITNIA